MRNTQKYKLLKKIKKKRTRKIKGGDDKSGPLFGNNQNRRLDLFDNTMNSIVNNSNNIIGSVVNSNKYTRGMSNYITKKGDEIGNETSQLFSTIDKQNDKYKEPKLTRNQLEEKISKMFEPNIWKQLSPSQQQEIVTIIQQSDQDTISKLVQLSNPNPLQQQPQSTGSSTCSKPTTTISDIQGWFNNGLSTGTKYMKNLLKSKKMPRMNDKLVVKLLRSTIEPDKFGGYVIFNPRFALPFDASIHKSLRSIDDMLYSMGHAELPKVFDELSLDITDQTQSKKSNQLQQYFSLSKELTVDNTDINKQDVNGNTLLLLACKGNNLSTVFDLIQDGADPKIKNKKDEDAFTLINQNKTFNEISEYINSFIQSYIEEIGEGNLYMKRSNMMRLFQSWCDNKGKCANKIQKYI
jgi:hypothetical protein